jgi:acetyl-CoA C-acetyltransferase
MSRDAVLVSVARTPIGRACKGAFNATPVPPLAAHVLRAAVARANVDPQTTMVEAAALFEALG